MLLVGFAIAMLARPGDLLAKQGPHSVGRGENQDLALQAPRRSTLAVGDAQAPDDGTAARSAPTLAAPGFVLIDAADDRDAFVRAELGNGERRRTVSRLRARGPPAR